MRGPFDEVMRRQEVEDKRLAREMRKYIIDTTIYMIFLFCVLNFMKKGVNPINTKTGLFWFS